MQMVEQRRKLPPMVNDRALFTRAAPFNDKSDPFYHSPSQRIGSNYSPQSVLAASILFEQFPQVCGLCIWLSLFVYACCVPSCVHVVCMCPAVSMCMHVVCPVVCILVRHEQYHNETHCQIQGHVSMISAHTPNNILTIHSHFNTHKHTHTF